jgi:drug/metabolite transporter (DMT)-like permease
MRLIFGAALLAVGVLLLVWGINSSQSTGSEVSRLFTGAPTNRAMGLIAGGTAASLVGLFMVVSPRRGKID